MSEELVQLYDAEGRPTGTASRAEMRRRNLTHAATAVVLRDGLGRVHVHRRTDTKDVYPGRWDFAAGGVVAAGEDPHQAALRELAEELGVTGVPLEPLGVAHYGDDQTDYWAHRFTATWEGPIQLQPAEVAEGDWWSVDRLVAALQDPEWPVMPDTARLLGDWVRERSADRCEVAEQGWDSRTEVVERRWIDRTPRRPEVAARLAVEVRLMQRLAPLLPLAVPVPAVMDTEPWRVRHAMVPGSPVDVDALTSDDGRRVGAFLRTLHDVPAAVWEGTGVAEDTQLLPALEEMRKGVAPLLPADLQPAGRSLLDRCAAASQGRVLRHGDLGPSHLLSTEGRVSGVIDWTDVALGDPALDLAWTVHGTPAAFRDALIAAYSPTREELSRGRDWHLLGPWWEVHHGLHRGEQQYVESGLAGAVERLRSGP